MLLCDFHIHTQYSDGKLSLYDVVDFYGQRNFDCIAITDHLCEDQHWLGRSAHSLNLSLQRKNFDQYIEDIYLQDLRAQQKYNMRVFPGYEITKNRPQASKSHHILIIGTTCYIDPNLSIKEISQRARSLGALIIAAHPVHTRKLESQTLYLWRNRQKLKNYFDAWEVASGPHLFHQVNESRLPKIASSDFHHRKHINSWKTIIHTQEKDFQNISHQILKQNLSFIHYKDQQHEIQL